MGSKQPSRKHYAEHYPLVMQRAGLTKSDDREKGFDVAIYTIFNCYWDALLINSSSPVTKEGD